MCDSIDISLMCDTINLKSGYHTYAKREKWRFGRRAVVRLADTRCNRLYTLSHQCDTLVFNKKNLIDQDIFINLIDLTKDYYILMKHLSKMYILLIN